MVIRVGRPLAAVALMFGLAAQVAIQPQTSLAAGKTIKTKNLSSVPGTARRKLISGTALAVCLASSPVGTDVLAQGGAHGRLGTAGVEVSRQAASGGTLIIIVNQGREFARYSAPAGTKAVLLCCSFGKCSPITPNTALVCDIVINCPGEACFPQ